jgi:hypothetical protein
MHTTPDEVLQGEHPTLKESTVEALPQDREVELLRSQRTRFDGYFTGPTW